MFGASFRQALLHAMDEVQDADDTDNEILDAGIAVLNASDGTGDAADSAEEILSP